MGKSINLLINSYTLASVKTLHQVFNHSLLFISSLFILFTLSDPYLSSIHIPPPFILHSICFADLLFYCINCPSTFTGLSRSKRLSKYFEVLFPGIAIGYRPLSLYWLAYFYDLHWGLMSRSSVLSHTSLFCHPAARMGLRLLEYLWSTVVIDPRWYLSWQSALGIHQRSQPHWEFNQLACKIEHLENQLIWVNAFIVWSDLYEMKPSTSANRGTVGENSPGCAAVLVQTLWGSGLRATYDLRKQIGRPSPADVAVCGLSWY